MDVLCYNTFMAQRITTTITDDITGEEGAATIAFMLDGDSYEIDLTEHNTKELRERMAQYVDNGRKVAGPDIKRTRTPRGARLNPPATPSLRVVTKADPATVRAWAQANGHQVNSRGRIAKELLDAFHAAGN